MALRDIWNAIAREIVARLNGVLPPRVAVSTSAKGLMIAVEGKALTEVQTDAFSVRDDVCGGIEMILENVQDAVIQAYRTIWPEADADQLARPSVRFANRRLDIGFVAGQEQVLELEPIELNQIALTPDDKQWLLQHLEEGCRHT